MTDVTDQATPWSTPEQLAAEMAQLFALSLIQDLPSEQLTDPHAVLATFNGDDVTLHALLCELRNLRWFDSDILVSPSAQAVFSPARLGENDRRRSINWNSDGQLTLRTLIRGPVARRRSKPAEASLWDQTAPPADPERACPDAEASLDSWSTWLSEARGVSSLSKDSSATTPRLAAQRIGASPAGLPVYRAALSALHAGQSLTPGLRGWGAGRLLSLLTNLDSLAEQRARSQSQESEQGMRPVVTAARLSLRLAREDRATVPDLLSQCAQELAYAAPRLLNWMDAANRELREDMRFSRNLFLPLCPPDRPCTHPADLSSHVLVAGAMATAAKALLDTSPVQDASAQERPKLLASELDGICAEVCMARCVSATHFPSENFTDLRTGEAMALLRIKDILEAQNAPTTLTLTDFDGARLEILCHAHSGRRGHAVLRRDGSPVIWPSFGERPSHLTAVS